MSIVSCPSCAADEVGVIDSRATASGNIRRRRKCANCGHRWSTIEVSFAAMQKLTAAAKVSAELLAAADRLAALMAPAFDDLVEATKPKQRYAGGRRTPPSAVISKPRNNP